jgi:hypothetical protein
MKNDSLEKYIAENQLSSCMNNTKWKELISEITLRDDFNPPVNIKYVFDSENNGLFSPVWWEEVERDGFNLIEWLEINPIKSTHIGRLVKPKTEDFSEFIENGLKKHSIPFELNDGIYKVYGYRR